MNVEELRKKAEASWEGCQGCDENDKMMWVNGYIKGALSNQVELPTDEEINKESEYIAHNYFDMYETNHYKGLKEGAIKMGEWVINKIQGGQDE